jgi:hypothetical protein
MGMILCCTERQTPNDLHAVQREYRGKMRAQVDMKPLVNMLSDFKGPDSDCEKLHKLETMSDDSLR